ncbi:hypothetical protein Ancab_032820 [Ancistrocladus abbreviatus]
MMKRIPRIRFPQRHPEPSGSSSQPQASGENDGFKAVLSKSAPGSSTLSASGKASLQPKRTPMSNEEIEAILVNFFKTQFSEFMGLLVGCWVANVLYFSWQLGGCI